MAGITPRHNVCCRLSHFPAPSSHRRSAHGPDVHRRGYRAHYARQLNPPPPAPHAVIATDREYRIALPTARDINRGVHMATAYLSPDPLRQWFPATIAGRAGGPDRAASYMPLSRAAGWVATRPTRQRRVDRVWQQHTGTPGKEPIGSSSFLRQ